MARSKKQKALDYDGEDIISNLHDSILSHILSFLPTKEAARTSLLSKRWRYFWTYVTTLEFHDESQYKFHAAITVKQKFLQLVNWILRQQILTSSIRSFTLRLSNSEVFYPSGYFNDLICCVLNQKVQKLCIKHTRGSVQVFPCAVFNCRSLIELDIDMPARLRLPSSNCLTNLRVLRLSGIDFFRDRFSHTRQLMLSVPLLKVLEIVHCKFLDVNDFIINAPMLESFAIGHPIFAESPAKWWPSKFGTTKLLPCI